jgi:hypothetical protein
MRLAGLLFVFLLSSAVPFSASEALTMRVSPAVSLAPAYLTVQTMVKSDADNRTLEITAESSEFFRSSEIQLDGQYAPRVSVFEFRALPAGLYRVRGILRGAHGERAKVFRLVNVVASSN